ncbi:MAG: serine hydrolase [Planctomycetaceae bacterium]
MRDSMYLTGWVAVILLLAAADSNVVTAQTGQFDRLRTRVTPLIEAHAGQVAVLVKHLNSGQQLAVSDSRVMPASSLIQTAVLVSAYREADAGQLDLSAKVELKESDKVPGPGVLSRHFSSGAAFSIRDLLRMMIVWSDNTAMNLVIRQLPLRKVAAAMDDLGCHQTRIHSFVTRGRITLDQDSTRRFGPGRTTAADMVRLLEKIYSHSAASETSCLAMLDHLRASDDSAQLARHFPAGTAFAHKSGAGDGVYADAGILETDAGPIVVCALTTETIDQSGNSSNVLLAKIGQEVLQVFSKPWPDSSLTDHRTLKKGDFGELVEVLQRTLNARLTPSPELAVDGDFGPATHKAVTKFQESRKISPDGIVGRQVWKTLSPLHFTAAPVEEPDVINAQDHPRDAADPDEGRPFVTCDAWAAVDGKTGKVIAGQSADLTLPMASTTKIMTAWIVLRIAEHDKDVLDEVLTFSRRADRTRGSTSAVREGESLSVRNTLFGLLLPSGNDASVALAEHFGARSKSLFEPGRPAIPVPLRKDVRQDPLVLFIETMNLEAERLGLTGTSYRNPHGLDAKGHQTTAVDLVQLAASALQNNVFRDIVDTRVYGCRVVGAAGYSRNVSWKNTNRLLGTAGYGGVKTGTTSQAGACLVSLSERNGQQTVLAVLGSAASAARYTDSRNLHRWLRRFRSGEIGK